MPQTFAALYLHAIFSTKNRHPFLCRSAVRDSVHARLAEISNRLDCHALSVGGVEDHVHILAAGSRTLPVAEWMKEIKRASSGWIKEKHPELQNFNWQSGYGVFSVSASNVADVRRYIESQAEHHRKRSFEDEFRAFLTRHDIPWDERYIWD